MSPSIPGRRPLRAGSIDGSRRPKFVAYLAAWDVAISPFESGHMSIRVLLDKIADIGTAVRSVAASPFENDGPEFTRNSSSALRSHVLAHPFCSSPNRCSRKMMKIPAPTTIAVPTSIVPVGTSPKRK